MKRLLWLGLAKFYLFLYKSMLMVKIFFQENDQKITDFILNKLKLEKHLSIDNAPIVFYLLVGLFV